MRKIGTARERIPDASDLNRLSGEVIAAAIEVHRELGPGLLESVYEVALWRELGDLGIKVERQVELPVRYKNATLDCGFRLDLWVDRRLIIEVKAVDKLLPIHQTQVQTYLRLTECRLGLLVNFNVTPLKTGIRRIVL